MAQQRSRGRDQVEPKVELGRAVVQVPQLELLRTPGLAELVVEHGLEHRAAGRVAWCPQGAQHVLEGRVLVPHPLVDDCPDVVDERGKGRVAGHVHAQGDRVEEGPDQQVGARFVPPCHGHADHHFVLCREAGEHRRPGGQDEHEGGDGAFDGHGANPLDQGTGHLDRDARPAVGHPGRAGPGRAQGEPLGCTAEVTDPVVDRRLVTLVGQPLRLVVDDIGELERQVRQRRWLPLTVRTPHLRQLSEQHPVGEAVGDQVVHRQLDQGVVIARDDRHPHQGRGGEVETGACVSLELRLQRSGVEFTPLVEEANGDRDVVGHDRHRVTVHDPERGPEDLVAGDDVVDAFGKRPWIDGERDAGHSGHHVERLVRGVLLEEPHALLGGGQGAHRAVGSGLYAVWCLRCPAQPGEQHRTLLGTELGEPVGECGHRSSPWVPTASTSASTLATNSGSSPSSSAARSSGACSSGGARALSTSAATSLTVMPWSRVTTFGE